MKRMQLSTLNDKERRAALQEAQLLQQLAHPNVVAYVDMYATRSKLFLFMQYCDGGDLEQRLNALGADIRRVNDCPEHVPRSLRLTQPGPPPGYTAIPDTVDGRQVRVDSGESVPDAPAVTRTPSRKSLPD